MAQAPAHLQLRLGSRDIFFAIASGYQALAAALSWNELLYRTWYPPTADVDGRLASARDGVPAGSHPLRIRVSACACSLPACSRSWCATARVRRSGRAAVPLLCVAAGVLALAVAIETYFQNSAGRCCGDGRAGSSCSADIALMFMTTLPPAGYALHPDTGMPVGTLFPPQDFRLLTPFLNVTGAFALILGAVLFGVVFMPKRRILAYSLDPQPDRRPVPVQPAHRAGRDCREPRGVAARRLPSAARRRIHSRVPATLLIAVGVVPTITDSLNRFGATELFQLGKFLGVVCCSSGSSSRSRCSASPGPVHARPALAARRRGCPRRHRVTELTELRRARRSDRFRGGAPNRAGAAACRRLADIDPASRRGRGRVAGPPGRLACVACNGSGLAPFSAGRPPGVDFEPLVGKRLGLLQVFGPHQVLALTSEGLRFVRAMQGPGVRGMRRPVRPHRFTREIKRHRLPRGPMSASCDVAAQGAPIGSRQRT